MSEHRELPVLLPLFYTYTQTHKYNTEVNVAHLASSMSA